MNTAPDQRQHLRRQFGGPVGDLAEVPCASQHGQHHHREHRADSVAYAPGLTRIGHPGEHVGQPADTDGTWVGVTGRRATVIQSVRH